MVPIDCYPETLAIGRRGPACINLRRGPAAGGLAIPAFEPRAGRRVVTLVGKLEVTAGQGRPAEGELACPAALIYRRVTDYRVETSPALTVCDLAERSQEYDGRVIAVRGEFAIRGGIQILRAFGCQTKGTRAIAEVTFEDAGEEGTPLPSPDAESAQLAVVLTVRGRFQRSDNGGGQSAGKLLFAETLEPEVRRRR